jgi:hypothetical protein
VVIKVLFAQLFLVGCFGVTAFVNEAAGALLRRDRAQGLWVQALAAFALLTAVGLGAGAGLLGSVAILLE